jgi:Holliday junction resolvase
MPNKQYLTGRRLEYQVRNFFKSVGMTVIRSAGSHGKWDVVAIDESNRIIYLVQCKRGKKFQMWNGGYYRVKNLLVGNAKQLYDFASGDSDG